MKKVLQVTRGSLSKLVTVLGKGKVRVVPKPRYSVSNRLSEDFTDIEDIAEEDTVGGAFSMELDK